MTPSVPTAPHRPPSRWRIAAWSAAAALLLLPAVAMQFTDEVQWGPADFLFAAVMIGSVGLAFELTVRRRRDRTTRAAVGVALATAFALTWVNLAVGFVGDEGNPANLLVAGVPLVAIGGAVLARGRAAGLARAMAATAFAQVAVAVVAQLAGWGSEWGATAAFTALWLLAAWLFRRAPVER
jgi:hypothetical protein